MPALPALRLLVVLIVLHMARVCWGSRFMQGVHEVIFATLHVQMDSMGSSRAVRATCG